MDQDSGLTELLRNFEVDPVFGFLLPYPFQKLPEQFQPWHDITDNLPELLASGELSKKIGALEVIDPSNLTLKRELRLAHLLLATLAAAHVWQNGRDEPNLSLPPQIAIPLATVSKKIGLPPIVCHASVCLANWRMRPGETVFKAENIELIAFRFMYHIGNHWFFTLTAQLETEFAPAIVAVARACSSLRVSNDTFTEVQRSLSSATKTIKRMSENLPPEIFYHGFRLFLGGYTEGKFLEQGGIIFEGREDFGPQMYNGGSAAQSSTLHVVDAFLGLHHSGEEKDFLLNQRNYMPPAHKRFIEWIERRSPMILGLRDSPEYVNTVAALKHFRDEHIKVVVMYIILQANPGAQNIGTGGTSFMKLLKNIRNDCTISP